MERDRLERLMHLIDQFPDEKLISRKNFAGHVTASGYVLDPSRRRVLLIRHKTLHRFLQPGGHVESEDASPLHAAIREIKEETSITSLKHISVHDDETVPIDIDIHPIPQRKDEPVHCHHDFRYLFVGVHPCEFVWNEHECSGYEWRTIDELTGTEEYQRLTPKIRYALEVGSSSNPDV
jgi:8-oxo-dGTP pyrophosphatase MutT (NUDIX family)